MDSPWFVELLGGLQASRGNNLVTRFQTQKTAALLGYLAYHRRRAPTREELIELLWPEEDNGASRHRLSQALSSLRNQLEPPGVPKGAVFTSDRFSIGLNRLGVLTDVEEFEKYLLAADRVADPLDKLDELNKAIELYRGEFLTGIYDEWATSERQRLSDKYSATIQRALEIATKNGEVDSALNYANRLVALDPLQEESHQLLMRLYLQINQPAAAVRQYEVLRTILNEQLSDAPSRASEELLTRANEAKGGKLHALKFPTTEPIATKPARVRTKVETKPIINLPIQFSLFFGREKELELANQLLLRPNIRLMTINGPGGCGKTRFSVELARHFAEQAGFSVWFVPLADISDAKLITDRILEVLPKGSAVGTPLQRIAEAVSAFPSLLVLDNFEHLVEEGSRTIRHLLEQATALKCIVSSRDQLFLEGEQEFRLEPLPCPPAASSPLGRIEIYSYASVQLFVDRAQKVKPEFQITDRNALAIADLCSRLEGIPLAIELAAEWSETVSPSQLAEKLAHRFAMLISRRRDIDPRHQTLRTAIDYSYSRLRPEAQQLFRFVSIFRGGFTEESAAAVCPDVDTRDQLNHILSKSLIFVTRDEDPIRYRMLETVREYALDQLTDDECEAVKNAHLRYFAGQIGGRELFEPDVFNDFATISLEIDNLRAAIKWSVDSENVVLGLGLAVTLSWFWEFRFGYEEGLGWLTRLLEIDRETIPKALVAAALNAAGRLAYPFDINRGLDFFQQALVLRKELGAESATISTTSNLGASMARVGRLDEAARYYEEAISRANAVGDQTRSCRVMVNFAQLHLKRGHFEEACALDEKALALSKELGDRQAEGCALFGLGLGQLGMGAPDRSKIYLLRSAEILKNIDFDWVFPFVGLCFVDLMQGRGSEAAGRILQLLDSEPNVLTKTGASLFLLCSFLAASQEDFELAATFLGSEDQIAARSGDAWEDVIEALPPLRDEAKAFRHFVEERVCSARFQTLKLNATVHPLLEILGWARNLCLEVTSRT